MTDKPTIPDTVPPDDRDARLRQLWAATPENLKGTLVRYAGPSKTPKSERTYAFCDTCKRRHETPSVHLDYLGHADTCRLIAQVDPDWTYRLSPEQALLWGHWEQRGMDLESGTPLIVGTPVVRDRSGYPTRLFIELTILGKTMPGVGTVATGKDDPEKELIGDAIRNAAMRFGVGADLWSKADHPAGDDDTPAPPPPATSSSSGGGEAGPPPQPGQVNMDDPASVVRALEAAGLPTTGNKAARAARLREYLNAQRAEQPAAADPDPTAADEADAQARLDLERQLTAGEPEPAEADVDSDKCAGCGTSMDGDRVSAADGRIYHPMCEPF